MRNAVSHDEVRRLIGLILMEAKTASEEYQANKPSAFHDGMAQAYTEVLDWLQHWCEDNDVDTGHGDIEELAVKWFG